MKKLLLVLISILLLTGVAQAADWTQALTADLSARNQGRCRVTDASVVIKVWQGTALTSAGVGVSANSNIILWTNVATPTGITINTGNTATDTVGEIVDYINTNFSSDSAVRFYASIGPDGYYSMPANLGITAANITVPGQTKGTASEVALASSRRMSVGVEATDGVTPRIKNIDCTMPSAVANNTTINIWDGNTRVWRKVIGPGAYNSSTANSSSANSVTFPDGKGISGTKGNGLVVEATTDANVNGDAWGAAVNQISIVYDTLRD